MPLERSIILANIDSLTAEQLFTEIKEGNITLEELMQTGDLSVVKRNKITALQRELEGKDEEDWEIAQRGGAEVSLKEYLRK